MPADFASKRARKCFPSPVEVACSWCGSGVPLPAGDFSGVCIDCGTVMFRDISLPHDSMQASFEHCIRSMEDHIGNHIGKTIPAPAV